MKNLAGALLSLAFLALAASAGADARPNSAVIITVHPGALVYRPNSAPIKARSADFVFGGDRVVTNPRGSVQMVLSDGSEFVTLPNSDFTLLHLGENGAGGGDFELLKGILQGAVRTVLAGHLRIETPSAVAAIKGTEYQIEASSERTELKVLKGRVDLGDPAGKGSVSVGAGEAALSYPDHVGAVRKMDRDEVEALRRSFLAKVRQAQSDYLQRVRALRGND